MKVSPMVIVRSFKLARDTPHDEVVKYKIAAETYFEADLQGYVVLGWHIAPSWEVELEDGMHLHKLRGRPIVQIDDDDNPVVSR